MVASSRDTKMTSTRIASNECIYIYISAAMAQEDSDLRRLHAATNRLFWCATSSWAAMGVQKGTPIARVDIKASDLANAVKQHLTETLLAQQLYLSEDIEDVVAAHAAFLKAVAAHTSRLSAGAVQ